MSNKFTKAELEQLADDALVAVSEWEIDKAKKLSDLVGIGIEWGLKAYGQRYQRRLDDAQKHYEELIITS